MTVPLTASLPGVRLCLGEADRVDADRQALGYRDPAGRRREVRYDRLVLATGSVTKPLPIPGIDRHAYGLRGIPDALYLRDHMIEQLELAAVADDASERAARRTFVVVGAGYTGTEAAAHGKLFTDELARRPGLDGEPARWMLLDVAERVLPEMDERMSGAAADVLRSRGIDVRLKTSVQEATGQGVRLSDGSFVATYTLIWCTGVRPDPLGAALGLPTTDGRLDVDKYLTVPGQPNIYACGDVAAVPDPDDPDQPAPMTAQHAVRQGRLVAGNIAASCGTGKRRGYGYRSRGFAIDLGGGRAVANPLNVHLSGRTAGLLTRGLHLYELPGNRIRVVADWLLDALLARPGVRLGLLAAGAVPLDSATPELPDLDRVASADRQRTP